MKRREIRRHIAARLKQGIPKNVIYQELLPNVPKDDLLAYISESPDAATRFELRTKNRVLIAILLFELTVNVVKAAPIIRGARSINTPWFYFDGWIYLFVSAFLPLTINDIRRFRPNGYRYVFLLTVILIYLPWPLDVSFLSNLLISCPWIPASFLAYRIMKKAHPYEHTWLKNFKSLDRARLENDLNAGLNANSYLKREGTKY